MQPSAVVFDLDNTLAVTRRDRQTLLDEATDAADVRPIDRTEYLEAHGSDIASETRAPIFEAIIDDGDPAAVAASYRDAIRRDLAPVDGAESLVRELSEDYRVGLLTDGPTRAQYAKLEHLGWLDLFDTTVVTGALPAGKPDRRAFRAVLEALEVDPPETVFVGDNPEADIKGAAAAGLVTVQVVRDGETPIQTADAAVSAGNLAAEIRGLLASQSRLP
jgi:putative hydrolase of the HAD superfamily